MSFFQYLAVADAAEEFHKAMRTIDEKCKPDCCACNVDKAITERALDTLHTEAIETDLQKLERLEAAAAPAPWSHDSPCIRDARGNYVNIDNQAFLIALRNAAPKLIFQAKNVVNLVADFDEVHAALGIDYNELAAPVVRKLKTEHGCERIINESLRGTCDTLQGKLNRLTAETEGVRIDNQNMKKACDGYVGQLATLRETCDALRKQLDGPDGVKACNVRQAATIREYQEKVPRLYEENRKLRDRLASVDKNLLATVDTQAETIRQQREIIGRLTKESSQWNEIHRQDVRRIIEQEEAVKKLGEANSRQGFTIVELRERERLLLSSKASLQRQNENLCKTNSERWDKILNIRSENFHLEREKERLKRLLDIATNRIEHFRACWTPKITLTPTAPPPMEPSDYCRAAIRRLEPLIGKCVTQNERTRILRSVGLDMCHYDLLKRNGEWTSTDCSLRAALRRFLGE